MERCILVTQGTIHSLVPVAPSINQTTQIFWVGVGAATPPLPRVGPTLQDMFYGKQRIMVRYSSPWPLRGGFCTCVDVKKNKLSDRSHSPPRDLTSLPFKSLRSVCAHHLLTPGEMRRACIPHERQ